MKHYYHPMSRGVTTDWMLHELDADHEQVVVDYMKDENNTAEFRAINPMGKLPALVDGDVVITEAAAICAYLADKYIDKGLAPALDSTERGRYYRYIIFPGNTIEPMFTVNQMEGVEYSPQSAGWGDMERVMASIESMTPAQDWVLGKSFSAADIVFGGTLDFSIQFGWVQEPTEKVQTYVKRLQQRPAYLETHPESWLI
ncbi:MAG: glutathione S-transferase [Candidatus Azotimanducaceae bacterium]|jgi:glutathione S-transferase